jgi:soluble lytic murein transglycosylase-like protein
MKLDELIQLARNVSAQFGLDPALVCAMCEHESNGWDTWAIRYEPAFYQKYVEPMNLSETEKHARSFSYGLMQVMGQVAREYGFNGKYLTELCDPELNLIYGCKKLARCMKLAKGDVREALLKYNGGGNPKYPDLVLHYYSKYAT